MSQYILHNFITWRERIPEPPLASVEREQKARETGPPRSGDIAHSLPSRRVGCESRGPRCDARLGCHLSIVTGTPSTSHWSTVLASCSYDSAAMDTEVVVCTTYTEFLLIDRLSTSTSTIVVGRTPTKMPVHYGSTISHR